MFNQIFDAIEEWMRELLTGMISSNLDRMFTDVNQKTSEIAGQVGQTPQGWNGSIFSMIEGLSNSVIMPIAGIIITFVLCYELISMLTERNNMHDIDTWMFFKYFVKMWIAVYLVSNTFTITMAVFDVGQSVVNSAAAILILALGGVAAYYYFKIYKPKKEEEEDFEEEGLETSDGLEIINEDEFEDREEENE